MQAPQRSPVASEVPSQRRLQRPADFTGTRIQSFRGVLLRHGMPGAVLAVACLASPDARQLLATGLEPLALTPGTHAAGGLVIFLSLLGYRYYLDQRLDSAALTWTLYLLAVSLAEECVFRVVIPYQAAEDMGLRGAVVASNGLFALLHYFTLRWKWQWCAAAFFGGMALSRLYHAHADLALIVAAHWIGTFLNTPREPQKRGHA